MSKFFIACMIACALPSFAQAAAPEGAAVEPAAATADAAASTLTDYKLGVADKVRIIVFNEETLSGEFIVGDGGTLSLPLIGEVKAIGRSPREITRDIEAKLADGYLREPRVSLDVLSYRPFYILGEVSKPGEYSYSNGLTIFNAVARAEGFTYRANKRKIYIKRFGEVVEKEIKLTPDLQVFPGDTVRIGERFF
ncbi:polysaccharide biosynthesis/export family protein [Sphingobium chlorophenolicum]|nr:polysaccharide biosynthesis/export family protein [Sphingobium chlorophenolicum]